MSEINGQEYVDLGLSVLWATKNIGACAEYESGDCFAWGETEPKSVYSMKSYKFGEWGNLSKYVNVTEFEDRYDFEYGAIVDSLTVLEPIDDAATCNWGSPWRMPTNKEYIELVTECEWIWIERYKGKDVNGYIVRGKNGNQIFLPCTVGLEYGVLYQYGRYWTSTLQKNRFAYEMFFGDNMIDIDLNSSHRYEGRPVRPVMERSDVATKMNITEESKIAWFDSILSWLENSDMTSLKKYCEGDSRKMIDVLYYYVPYLNKPQKKVWYNEYKCERSFIGVPTKYEDAIKCVSYKLKAYFWMILINNGLMEDDGKYICVFYEGEKAIYDKSFYYDYKSSSFVYENCDNRELDEKFRKWYEALKDNDREKAQAELQKISYKTESNKCR